MYNWKRMFFALLLVPPINGIIALVINLALFWFGPWADVWTEETWAVLMFATVIAAFVFRKKWCYVPEADTSAHASA